MTDLLNKLESYRIFNYLYPGSLFLFACQYLGLINLDGQNLVTTGFTAYFAGMTISRLGALIIDDVLRYFRFVKYAPYEDYVAAEKSDEKIKLLAAEANTFRTLATLFALLAIMHFANREPVVSLFGTNRLLPFSLVALTLLYAFSFRRQVGFVVKRIKAQNQKS